MYCQCHLDESNPHIHIGVVPITPDGRLSAKSLFCPKTLEQAGIVPLQLSRVPDINWDMINWDLLSSLEKEELREKIALAHWL